MPSSQLFHAATATSPSRVMVIAEVGVNHDGQLERALSLADAAAEAGADAIKLQLFHPSRLLSNQAMLAGYQTDAAEDAQELLAGLTLTLGEMRMVAARAQEAGLAFVVTPFSPADVDDAAALPLDAIKIASPDAVNLPLLRAAARLGKPLIVSTGTCELEELEPVSRLLREHAAGGCLLQCVSSYPASAQDASLGGIGVLRDRFSLPVGYSDHTTDPMTGAVAVAAGAVVVEKHLTYDRAARGPDHAASLDPVGFADYVRLIRQAGTLLGPRSKRVLPVEADVRQVSRQSVCAVRDLAAGHRLTAGDVTVKRPGTGIAAAELDQVIGRVLARAVGANDLLQRDDLA